jgi:hypothetical protein
MTSQSLESISLAAAPLVYILECRRHIVAKPWALVWRACRDLVATKSHYLSPDVCCCNLWFRHSEGIFEWISGVVFLLL